MTDYPYRRDYKTPADVDAAITEMNAWLDATAKSEDRMRDGTRIHGELRRMNQAQKDMALPASPERAALRTRLNDVVDRVLVEVFNIDPAELAKGSTT